MALSVRLEPVIEARLEQEAKRLGITKSEFVKDTLERALGLKNPAELLAKIRSSEPTSVSDASERVKEKLTAKLREKHSN